MEISHTVSVLYSNTTVEDLASSTSLWGKVFQFVLAFNFHTWINWVRVIDYEVFSINAVHNLPFFSYYSPVLVLTKQIKTWENYSVHKTQRMKTHFKLRLKYMSQAVNLTPDLHLFGLNKRSKISLLCLKILQVLFTKLLLNYFHFCSIFSTFEQT